MKTLLTFSYCLIFLLNTDIYAEALTDGSMGAIQSLSGQMQIPQSLGTTAGNNLFHSFKTFNIQTGESATFTGNDSIQNVINRVTGGQISNVNGLLKSEVGNANFYFINPAGVTFGVNAAIDVPAAFHVSTANSLKFTDGKEFSASNPTASKLSIAEPASFGFLGSQSGNINIQGSSLIFNAKNPVSLTSSGDVIINNGSLINPSGAITINAKRNVSLNNGSFVDTSTHSVSKGGDITVTATNFTVDNSEIRSNATENSQGNAGAITVQTQELVINGSGDKTDINKGIHSRSFSTGDSGAITITTDRLAINNVGGISASAYQQGNAGNVIIQAKELVLNNGGYIASNTINNTLAQAGNAGLVKITGNSLTVLNGGQISNSTWGAGNAGDVNVNVGQILINGQGNVAVISSDTYSDSLTHSGHAGLVNITSNNLAVLNAGQISSITWGTGDAGNVTVNADKILVDGQGYGAWIISDTYNSTLAQIGHAGTVSVTSHDLTLANGGKISSDTFGFGKGGDVSVQTDTLNAYGSGTDGTYLYRSGVSAAAQDDSTGQTGYVNVIANKSIYLHDGGELSIKNEGVAMDGSNVKAGVLNVSSPDISLENAGTITAQSIHNVEAGNIAVKFSHALVLNSAFITTSANLDNGGSITINGDGLINLHNSGFLTSVTGTNSNGGNININADALIMNNGVIQANAISGLGGNINLQLNNLISSQNQLIKGGSQVIWQPFIENFNVIQASSENGISGSVNITSPQFNINGAISRLESLHQIIPVLDRNFCQGLQAISSTLLRGGKGGLPNDEAKIGFIPLTTLQPDSTSHQFSNLTQLQVDILNQENTIPCARQPLI